MTTPYQTQDHIYTQATGTTANEVPAPTYNEKPPPAHQPSYHQDPQPVYTHPQDTTSQVHTPGVYQAPSQQQQQQQYYQDPNAQQYHQAASPDAFHSQQQSPPPPADFYQQQQQQQQKQQQQQQQQAPVQPQQQVTGGAAPMPLDRLQRYPEIAACPVCARTERTRTEYVSGGMTHLSALALCFIACLGCIPYFIYGLKDVEHYCGNCGAILAVWHRSGHTEVLAGRGGPAPARKPVAGAPAAGAPPPAAKASYA